MYIAIVNQTDSILEMLLYHIQLSNHNILLCKFRSKPLNVFISGLKKKLFMSFCMLEKSVMSLIFELLCSRLVEVCSTIQATCLTLQKLNISISFTSYNTYFRYNFEFNCVQIFFFLYKLVSLVHYVILYWYLYIHSIFDHLIKSYIFPCVLESNSYK